VFLASCHRDLSLTQYCVAEDIHQQVLIVWVAIAQPQWRGGVVWTSHSVEPSPGCSYGKGEECSGRKEATSRNTAAVRIHRKGVRKTRETADLLV